MKTKNNLIIAANPMLKQTAKLMLIATLLITEIPKSFATDLVLEGNWSYNIKGYRYLFLGGVAQSGSYKNLGGGYYRYGAISGGDISNQDDSYNSGSISLEFWRVNYYGGDYGTRMFTRGFKPLSVGYYYSSVFKSGYFKSSNKKGYGRLFLNEYNYSWYYTDTVDFTANQKF